MAEIPITTAQTNSIVTIKNPDGTVKLVYAPNGLQIGLEDSRFRSGLTVKGPLRVTGSFVITGSTTQSGSLSMEGYRITNMQDPINPEDAATKNYADNPSGGAVSYWKLIGTNLYTTSSVQIGAAKAPSEILTVQGNISGSGQVFAGSGSAANPSYTFGDDTNTGFFSLGASDADTIYVSSAGGARFRFKTTAFVPNADTGVNLGAWNLRFNDVFISGQITGSDGSAASPTYTFGTTSNTGIYSPSSGQIGLATGGSLRVSIDSTNIKAESLMSLGGVSKEFYNLYLDNDIYYGGTLSGSNITIGGDASIGGNLTVTGSQYFLGDLSVSGTITAREFHTEYVSASIIYESGSTKFGDSVDDIHQMTGSFQQAAGANSFFLGSLGVGTISPSNPLHVNGGSTQVVCLLTGTSNVYQDLRGNAIKGIRFRSIADAAQGFIGTRTDLSSNNISLGLSNTSSPVIFVDTSSSLVGINTSVPTEALTVQGNISGSGNLHLLTGSIGIGTATPSYDIHISKLTDASIYLEADTDNVTETDNAFMKLSQDGAVVAGILGFVGSAGKDPEGNTYTSSSENALLLGTTSSYPLQFGTAAAIAITIDSAQEVGIGPGATSPGTTLHVKESSGDTTLRVQQGDTSSDAILDLYGGRQWHLIANRSSTVPNSGFRLRDSSIGLDRLVIDANGKVGIGNVAPTEVLTVEGNISGSAEIHLPAFNTTNNTGMIGIGTSTPTHPLHIVGSLLGTGIWLDSSTGAACIVDRGGTTNNGYYSLMTSGSAQWEIGNKGESNDHLYWYVNAAGAGNATHAFLDTGLVGFGTKSPTEVLTVNGNISGSGDLSLSRGAIGGLLYATGTSGITGIDATPSFLRIIGGDDTVAHDPALLFRNELSNQDWGIFMDVTDDFLKVIDDAGTVLTTWDDNNNRVGVGAGATAPGTTLEVRESAGSTILRIRQGDTSSDGILELYGGRQWQLIANNSATSPNSGFRVRDSSVGSDRMIIDSNGNVGINTTAPQTTLDVKGGITISHTGSAAGSTSGINFSDPSTNGESHTIYMKKGSKSLNIGTYNTAGLGWHDSLTILTGSSTSNDGISNIGINNNDPTSVLDISGSDNSNLLNIKSNSSSNILFVTGSGRVGIGTSSPSQPLTVQGNISGSGQILGVGAEATPTFSFAADPDTGMYLSSTATVGFASAGDGKIAYNATHFLPLYNGTISTGRADLRWKDIFLAGQISGSDGSAAAPTYTFKTVRNAGLYYASSRVYGAFGGFGIWYWDGNEVSPAADNTVDLGNSTYRWKNLYISGQVTGSDGSAAAPTYTFGTTSNTGIYQSSNILRFSINGALRSSMSTTAYYPQSGIAYDLGTSGQPFNDLYCSGTLSGSNITIGGDASIGGNLTVTGSQTYLGDVNITGSVYITGHLAASTKSFFIDHPSKPGKKLQHGSLEGPEFGVYVRGRVTGSYIDLPDYWRDLIDESSITVNLTSHKKFQKLIVDEVTNKRVKIRNSSWLSSEIDASYVVFGERKDISKMKVE